jgi:Derlin-2/3
MGDHWQWYMDIPVVSRTYLTASFMTTAACALDVVSPFSLYFNSGLIFYKGQFWRIITNFLFFGLFSLDFLFHMYFLVRYCWYLEDSSRFRGRTGDFVWMLFIGAFIMTCLAPFISVHFLGSSLTFMMVYIWGRLNPNQRMSFLGLFPFTAPYLPWVLLIFSVLLGNPVTIDLVGIAVGHTYYFFDFIFPVVAELRGWRMKRIIKTPFPIRLLNADQDEGEGFRVRMQQH